MAILIQFWFRFHAKCVPYFAATSFATFSSLQIRIYSTSNVVLQFQQKIMIREGILNDSSGYVCDRYWRLNPVKCALDWLNIITVLQARLTNVIKVVFAKSKQTGNFRFV